MKYMRTCLKSWMLLGGGVLAILVLGLTRPAAAGEKIILNVVTAGDTNMHELQKNVFGPAFTQKFPNVEINAVGSGPGDPGSRVIFQKLKSEKDANVHDYRLQQTLL
jgi:hypothetical protein